VAVIKNRKKKKTEWLEMQMRVEPLGSSLGPTVVTWHTVVFDVRELRKETEKKTYLGPLLLPLPLLLLLLLTLPLLLPLLPVLLVLVLLVLPLLLMVVGCGCWLWLWLWSFVVVVT
jgi:hypothetical protein